MRNFFRLWLILLLIWLASLCAAWWWMGWAEWALRVLRVLANLVLPGLLFQHISGIVLQADQSWKLVTRLIVEGSVPVQRAVFFIDKPSLLHIIMGFPLLWALLLATPGAWLKRLIWGTLLLGGVCLLAIAGNIWAMIAVMVNHQPSIIVETLISPPFHVSATPYPEWLFHLSSFAYYLATLIVPVIAPVLIWVMLCPRGVMRLVVSLRRHVRGKKSSADSTRQAAE